MPADVFQWFSLSAAIPTLGFSVIQGDPVIGGLHGETRHYFCPYCMTWMFTRPEGLDFFVNLRPTMLDDPGWFTPFVETYTNERLPWATTHAVHSFGTMPALDRFDGLIKEYAQRAARVTASS